MDPYYSYRHFKEQKDQLERQSRMYHEYINRAFESKASPRAAYYIMIGYERAVIEDRQRKPTVPEDGFWITTQEDAKHSFKEADARMERKKKAEQQPAMRQYKGLRPSY